jgi:hypothetical protein
MQTQFSEQINADCCKVNVCPVRLFLWNSNTGVTSFLSLRNFSGKTFEPALQTFLNSLSFPDSIQRQPLSSDTDQVPANA